MTWWLLIIIMPTINQLIRKGRLNQLRKSKTPALGPRFYLLKNRPFTYPKGNRLSAVSVLKSPLPPKETELRFA